MEHSPSWDPGTRIHLGLKAALCEITALEPRRGREIDYLSKLCLKLVTDQTVPASLTGVRFWIPVGQSYIQVLHFLPAGDDVESSGLGVGAQEKPAQAG